MIPKGYRILTPIKEDPSFYDEIEERILKVFKKLLYEPILDEAGIAKLKNIWNAKDGGHLVDALRKGFVTFSKGAFRGKFNSYTSKDIKALGGIWDKKTSSFKILLSDVPPEIKAEIATSAVRFGEKLGRIDKKLSQILSAEIADSIKISDLFDQTLWKIEKDIQKTLSNITVEAKLSPEQREKIAEEWQNNMKLWITDFSEKEIIELRKTVQDTIFSGNRYESLLKGIQDSYGVTARKAKFLARQETSLLMAKFKETRYTAAGVNEYMWGNIGMPKDRTPNQHTPGNVRYSHAILEGKVFRWNDPPVTTAPGEPEARNNPGQDYNCRCFARPLAKFGD